MNNDSISCEYCPYCQMPLVLLQKQNLNLHLEVCSRRQSKVKLQKECPKGLKCDCTMICHYERYSHTMLADARSKNNIDQSTQQSSVCTMSTSLLTYKHTNSSSEDFAAEKLQSSKRRKLHKTAKHSLLSQCTNFAQENLSAKTKQNMKKTNSLDNLTSAASLLSSSFFEPKKKNMSNTFQRNSSSTTVTELISSNYSGKENDDIEEALQKESTCITKKVEGKTSPQYVSENNTALVNGFSCTPIAGNVKTQAIVMESSKEVEFLENDLTNTSTQVFSDQNDMVPDKCFVSLASKQMQQYSVFDKSKKAFQNVIETKKVFKKQKQADIGSLLFGMKPLESKKIEPPIEKNIENDYISLYSNNKKRKCPFYKKVDGTYIAVDAFSYGLIPGIKFYFLSHFHYDHYIGLNKKFQEDIYCSHITGNLLETRLGLPSKKVKRLPMNNRVQIGNVFVTLLEANHCPGAVLFLFRLTNGRCILHTGDFRADAELLENLRILNSHIDVLYLDTTYLDPNYSFPPQNDVIQYVTGNIERTVAKNPLTLVVTGTYCIGKEKIFMGIAKRLDVKVFVSRDKEKVLKCMDDVDINLRITTDPALTNLHVLPMNKLNPHSLHEYLRKYESSYNRLVAIKPTGWTFKGTFTNLNDLQPTTYGSVTIYGVPYSEHSSFSELRKFVETLKPNRIIPTVNVGKPESRKLMESYLNCWKRR